ncbi:hypothetical protein [Mycobacteroides abscessus]|uniref:hypothetical protein n=1 Tax=Mycobacteroides abscessus TaxID=36809 RepID=UPI0009C4A6F0|nr:hypothetical protein [Mycobacteroides abscessus]SKK32978.1 Uncharacterised protein [Mycobacteroides abscessus subsp. abscessus]
MRTRLEAFAWVLCVVVGGVMVWPSNLVVLWRLLAPGAWGQIAAAALLAYIAYVPVAIGCKHTSIMSGLTSLWGLFLTGTVLLSVVSGQLGNPIWFCAFWFVPMAIVGIVRGVNRFSNAPVPAPGLPSRDVGSELL